MAYAPQINDESADITRILRPVLDPALADLADRLSTNHSLSTAEREVVCSAAARTLREVVWRLTCRVVVLELHIARRAGRLTAGDSAGRWREWVEHLSEPAGWDALAVPYPVLRPRLQTVVRNRCAAVLRFARRFATDRAALAHLAGADPGELAEVSFGAGDSHDGGQTATLVRTTSTRLFYKPRSLAVDGALAALLPRLLPDEPDSTRIRVPATLTRQDAEGAYGWAEHVAHRYCADESELRAYYRGIGHWLAVLRLLAGTDLHAENLVAVGPVPVMVDCETLFTPLAPVAPSGYGQAVDLATESLRQSLLSTGLLPIRGAGLGMRGVDLSGAGAIPEQQPVKRVPGLVGLGSDEARMGMVELVQPPQRNLPAKQPDPARYWEHVVDGFDCLTDQLHRLDRTGQLTEWLAIFADCPIRVVLRDTASYAEIRDMLWHPSSLHQPESAIEMATGLLARQAANQSRPPGEPDVIAAEVADLLDDDIPTFVTTPRSDGLAGPRGTRYGQPADLLAGALARWRAADPAMDRRIIRSALLSAYLDDRWQPGRRTAPSLGGRARDLDKLRRTFAASIIRQLDQEAVHGDDGTVTWVAPAYGATGWMVQPIPANLYSGLAGVAVTLSAYRTEMAAGRVDGLSIVDGLLTATLATLRRADDQQAADLAEARAAGIEVRPEPPGAYSGLASRILGWLLLHRLGAVDAAEAERRAEALADRLRQSIASDEAYDLMGGAAGAVVPLLALAARAGRDCWAELARAAGDRLQATVRTDHTGARWPTAEFPDGLGGLAHGAAGIGWALARLAPFAPHVASLADAAFDWQETLYHPDRPGWRDLRARDQVAFMEAWCHGAVGIGLAAADLLPRSGKPRWGDLLARAASVTLDSGLCGNYSLCHGDLGAWELLARADRAGLAPSGLDRDRLAADILTGLREHGPRTSVASHAVFQPGLVLGAGGVAYQLLRLHPECQLPSVLLPDPEAAA